jgi:pimeloyl-ACP methyl ester carboxylesterase
VIVLVHGLLMDVRMFTALAPMLAAAGNRVILADMLGHGASAQPHDMADYSMPQFGRDVIALLDHLGVQQAVVGGTSLGANVALEAAVTLRSGCVACSWRCRCSRAASPRRARSSCRWRSRCA